MLNSSVRKTRKNKLQNVSSLRLDNMVNLLSLKFKVNFNFWKEALLQKNTRNTYAGSCYENEVIVS